MTATLPDARERARAEGSITETLLVEASAGTGKTTTMVRRLVALLTTPRPGEADPPSLAEIIAITFTERAAQELKDRLRAELFTELRHARNGKRSALAQALGDLEQAPIGTIHSLCSRILRQYPLEAGVDVQFSVADERATDETVAKLWREWLSREFHRTDIPEAVRYVVENGIRVEDLQGVARALLSRRAWPVADILAENDAAIGWDAQLRRLEDWIALVRDGNPTTGKKLVAGQVALVKKMSDWLAALREIGDETEREKWVLAPLPFNGKNSPVAKGFLAIIARVRAAITHRTVAEVLRWIGRPAHSPDGPGFLAEYARTKQTLGILDFDDLLIRARDLVRDRLDIRRELQAQYRAIIVDEFQDTDPVQTDLITYLAQQPNDAPDVPERNARLVPGKLCVVGDPKQSIYRFRGADIETYSQVADLVGTEGTCRLRTNFRSHPHIIKAINAVFSREGVFGSPGEKTPALPYKPVYQPLEARPDADRDESRPRVIRLMPENEAFETKLETSRPREAALVAAAIRQIVDEEWPVSDPATKKKRPAEWSDVAMLFRTATHLDHYERAFQQQGVPYRVIGSKGFFVREEIVRLISVLTAIEQPGDALNVVAALRSPFFGVSDADLAATALLAAPRFDYRDAPPGDAPQSVREAFSCLRELYAHRQMKTPAALVQELYERTKVLSVYAQTTNGEQAVANLLKVLDEARRLERDGPIPFRRLCEYLLTLKQEGGEEGEAIVEDEGGKRVRMLTIHKAKGLEFPIVIVGDLAARMNGGGNQGTRLIGVRADAHGRPSFALRLGRSLDEAPDVPLCSAEWHDLKAADDERERAESVRLLYVALTRARDYLLLPKVMERKSRTKGAEEKSWQDIIEQTPEWKSWAVVTPRSDRDHAPAPPAEKAVAAPDYERMIAEREALVERRKERTKSGSVARVHIRRPSLHETERGSPDEETPPVGVDLISVERAQARALGTVVHAALERLSPGDDAHIEQAIHELATAHQLADEHREAAVSCVRRGLEAHIVQRAARAPRSWKEVPVTMCEEIEGETVVTRGICDLVFLEDSGLVVIDYKTDHGSVEDISGFAAKYGAQVREYARALEAATGQPVTEAWLCFLGVGERAWEKPVAL